MSEKKWYTFAAAAKKDWLGAAQRELQGEDPLQKLAHREGNILLAPYYDDSDLPDTHLFTLPPSKNQWSEPRFWSNCPKVVVDNARDANLVSLDHLQFGADGILFEINSDQPEIETLLADIELNYCSIFFAGDLDPAFIASFRSFAGKNFRTAEITGGMFHAKPVTDQNQLAQFHGWNNFHPAGFTLRQQPTPEETLVELMRGLVSILNHNTNAATASQLGVSVDVTHHLFTNVALLKAARILGQAVLQAFGVAPAPICIHGRCEPWHHDKLAPHENMLAGTTSAIAAVLGGMDAVTIVPSDPSDAMQTRVARNISSILREEARISLTADATAGSYYLESFIDSLVRTAWSRFVADMKTN